MSWPCLSEQISSKEQLFCMGPRTVPCLTRLHASNDCVFPTGVVTMISAFLFKNNTYNRGQESTSVVR